MNTHYVTVRNQAYVYDRVISPHRDKLIELIASTPVAGEYKIGHYGGWFPNVMSAYHYNLFTFLHRLGLRGGGAS